MTTRSDQGAENIRYAADQNPSPKNTTRSPLENAQTPCPQAGTQAAQQTTTASARLQPQTSPSAQPSIMQHECNHLLATLHNYRQQSMTMMDQGLITRQTFKQVIDDIEASEHAINRWGKNNPAQDFDGLDL